MRRAVIAVLAIIVLATITLTVWPKPDPPVPPPPTPTVVVNPQTLPTTPLSQVKGPKPGQIPNGLTPGEVPVDDTQVVGIQDGLGGGVSYVRNITRNPWTPQQAVAFAASQVVRPKKDYYNLCAHAISTYYGYEGYGYQSAKAGGLAVPKKYRHSAKDRFAIPAGAIVYFVGSDTGRYGHVVLSDGKGRVFSNDISRRGKIDLVNLNVFKQRWGMSPSFWTEGYLPQAFGRNSSKAPVIETVAVPAPKPAPKKQTVVLAALIKACRTNGRYSGVVPVRKALGIAGGTKCDAAFRKSYAKWQRKLGYSGRGADGVPGKASLVKLARKSNKFKAGI